VPHMTRCLGGRLPAHWRSLAGMMSGGTVREGEIPTFGMRRREFITLLGGTAATWPLAARAQQADRMRRIGVLLPATADDAEFQARVGAFLQALALLGWSIGRNVRIDTRWATTNVAEIRRHATELAAMNRIGIVDVAALAAGAAADAPVAAITATLRRTSSFAIAGSKSS
jgi:hypothetical protein